jgi:hypothetical protein
MYELNAGSFYQIATSLQRMRVLLIASTKGGLDDSMVMETSDQTMMDVQLGALMQELAKLNTKMAFITAYNLKGKLAEKR